MNRRYKPLHVVISQVAAVVISADIAICGRPWWRGGSAVWRAQEVTAAIAVRSKDKLCLPNIGRGPYREFLRRRESRETCLCRARRSASAGNWGVARVLRNRFGNRTAAPILTANYWWKYHVDTLALRGRQWNCNWANNKTIRGLCLQHNLSPKTGKGLIIASCRNKVCSALNCRHLWHFTPTFVRLYHSLCTH